ncbi:MAG: glycosyltransferase family 4 protein [Gemmatales bacterium]|nr:glycosyltransferase family 4 protein [Gemmatales bacterium]
MLSSNEAMNMVRFLPVEYARIGVVHVNSVATINAAVALAPYLDEIVAPSVRVAQMVQRRLRAEKSITVIPHAVDREFFQVPVSPFGRKEATIAYIGRLSHLDKGVLDLPKIVRYVKAKPLKLKIVGAGPDEQALRARLSAVDADVEWQGPVSWEELPDILREIDVVVVPSRLEGFCFVAAEAMAAGRTVVMSRIKGVADQLIRHGENGFLFDVGDLRAAARWIDESVADRSRLAAIGEAAKFAMRSLCSMETFAEAYREVMVRAKMRRPEKRLVEPLESWDLPKGLRPGIRAYLPEAVKRYARLWRERLAR